MVDKDKTNKGVVDKDSIEKERIILKILREIIKEFYTDESKKKESLKLIKRISAVEKGLGAKLPVIQESLYFLRVQMKYLLFDIESTRRERDYFKVLLEENC